jgi:hypothetical protein
MVRWCRKGIGYLGIGRMGFFVGAWHAKPIFPVSKHLNVVGPIVIGALAAGLLGIWLLGRWLFGHCL